MRCWGIHLIGISHKTLKLFIAEMSLKFPNLRLQSNPPGGNELMAICERTHDIPSEGASDVEHISISWYHHGHTVPSSLIARFMGPTCGPIWGQQDPGGPQVGLMNFAIWAVIALSTLSTITSNNPKLTCKGKIWDAFHECYDIHSLSNQIYIKGMLKSCLNEGLSSVLH